MVCGGGRRRVVLVDEGIQLLWMLEGEGRWREEDLTSVEEYLTIVDGKRT